MVTVRKLNVRLMAEKAQRRVKCTDGARKILGVLELFKSAVSLNKPHVVCPTVEVHSTHDQREPIRRRKQGITVSATLFKVKS